MHSLRKLAGAFLAIACMLLAQDAGAEESGSEPAPDGDVAIDVATDAATDIESEDASEDESEGSRLGPGMPRFHRELDRASDFAPTGILLDHTHEKGDWTFLYRFQWTSFEELLIGDTTTLAVELIPPLSTRYESAPVSQVVRTHLFGAMYAPHPRFTFALLLPYHEKEVSSIGDGLPTRMETRGVGDFRLMFMLPFVQKGEEKSQFNVGVSFPTGSIEERDALRDQRLPYVMQLGSGTYDIHWGLAYTGAHENMSWGGQFESIYRLGSNSVGYRVGSMYGASAWVAGSLGSWITTSARVTWRRTNNIHDSDPSLDKTISPLNDNLMQGGTYLGIGPGLNLLLPYFGGQRFAVEVIIPIYQSLDGPQLARALTVTAGWQWLY